jgi:hypothetical protein
MTRFYHNYPLSFRIIPAKNIFYHLLRSVLLATTVLLVVSCEEGPTKIGSELLPSSDFVSINSSDTLSSWSYTMYNDSIPSSNSSIAFIGDLQDPYFGTTTAGFVSQLRLGSAWKYGPVTVDSVKMRLTITTKGGSVDIPHIMRLAEIADTLYTDATYYSNTQTHTTGYEVSGTLPTLKADTINTISFSLPVSFGEYLIRDTTRLFYSPVLPDFRTYFKGLYMSLTPTTDPLMITFNLTLSNSVSGGYDNFITIYMHDTAFVTKAYFFILDPIHPNARYNKFDQDFSTADPDKRISHINDETYRDSLSYLQALNGLYTKIVFPGLDSVKKELSKGKFSINKARLFVPVYYDGDRYTATTVPSSLRIRYTDNDGVKHEIPDYSVDANHQFYDGTLHKLDSTYYFNIASYIQLYLDDKQNIYKPELEIYQGPTVLSSAILRTSKNSKPVKFEMTYTKF